MNDTQITEGTKRISAVEKKYLKNVGQLFWIRDTQWKPLESKYEKSYYLVSVSSLTRRWGANRYLYQIDELNSPERNWCQKMESAEFMRRLEKGLILPVDPANPNPPPSYLSDNWHD